MTRIDGGIAAPQGFLASGTSCGLKKNGQADLALLVSREPAAWAGVFTSNRIKGHSLLWTRDRKGARIRGVMINSGNANTALGKEGETGTRAMAGYVAEALHVRMEEVLLASTGVIGRAMDLPAVACGVESAAAALSPSGGAAAARAIMTTDTFPKEAAVSLMIGGREVKIGGMAKGSGMIHPNMATLLGFLTTDAPIGEEALDLALREAVAVSFNAITVDGDTSPCDSVVALANGLAGGDEWRPGSPELVVFTRGLIDVAQSLAKMVARDGEGATKLLTITVTGADSVEDAHRIGRCVGTSCLVKTAIFGSDANWGRILTAVGNAGVAFDPACVSIRIGEILVCTNGSAVEFSEDEARRTLDQSEVGLTIDLGLGSAEAIVWTCDLTDGYIRINGSYRS